MHPFLSLNLAASWAAVSAAIMAFVKKYGMTWFVFFLCLVFSAIGVFTSFAVIVPKVPYPSKKSLGMTIALAMLGINYLAKYANASARESFTPVDVLQYFLQGFLWPSAWPSLANLFGTPSVEPPEPATHLIHEIVRILTDL